MKKSIIKIITSLVFTTVLSGAFAFDFGGTVNDTTKFTGADFSSLSLDQKNTATLWVKTPFNNKGSLYMAAEGTFQYEYVQSADKYLLTADCDLFKFGGIFDISKNKLIVSAGRFIMTDSTGLIFTQACDGVSADINLKRFTFGLYGGYTGFLNAQSVTELNSSDSTYAYDSTYMYPLAAPYAAACASFSAPYLFANQTIGAQFLGFFGVPGITCGDATVGYNRMYGTLAMNGPLSSAIFYTFTTTMGTNDNFKSISNLSQIQVGWYPAFKSSSISAKCIYASGANGILSSFTTFTSGTVADSLAQPQYSGNVIAGLSASIKPIEPLYISVGADCVFDCPENSIGYSGFQYNANIRYQIFTDLQASIIGNQYFDIDGTDNKTTLTAKAVISF